MGRITSGRALLFLLLAGCGAKSNQATHDHEPGSRGEECALGQILCDGACTDVASDSHHCGSCDESCGGDECRSGVCGGGKRCPEAMVDCEGECRDLSGDPEYCGGCDQYLCRGRESCWNGICVCRPELTPCGELGCVDGQSDPANCGDCGVTCDGGTCARGACVEACTGAGLTDCGGACVELDTNPLHCGSCGSACAQDQICLGGGCRDYEPAIGCASCAGCGCPEDEQCCELIGYGVSCVDTRRPCPEPPTQH